MGFLLKLGFREGDIVLLNLIEYKNQRVLTTAQLAKSLKTDSKIINQNFRRNKDDFIQGVHYLELTGEELKAFKGSLQNEASLKFASILYLWTEKGAWIHADFLNTKQARKAIHALIDEYYKTTVQRKQTQKETLAISYEQFQQIERRVEALEQQLRETVTLHSGEQIRLRKAVGERVSQLTTVSAARPALFRAIYSALKERYCVSSYRDIKQHELQDALKFVYSWRG